ncbi:MAG: GNAT family N-acetyltransferase [Wenzhouxiangellaceae bacterium]|nr:GNAT family N-acetyltransferase [Wenzhouxiangellaceae bacterium]
MTHRFRTARLILRAWSEEDRPALERMSGDALMMRHVAGRPWTADEVSGFLDRQRRWLDLHGTCIGAVEWAETAEVIGVAGLQPLTTGEFELAWWTWRPWWGRGIAPEAIAPYVVQAREELGLDHCVAVIAPGNAASIAVARKLGMELDREVPGETTRPGRGQALVHVYRLDFEKPARRRRRDMPE